MKYILIVILLFLFANKNFAQVFFGQVCATEGNSVLKSAELSFTDITNEPIKHVRTNFIFLRKNDGTGGFLENNPDHQQHISNLITGLDSIYSNIPSSYDPTCYNGAYGVFSDTKIRFDVNVMYINDSFSWNNENSIGSYYSFCPGETGYHLININNQIAQNSTEPAINVFFTEDESAYENIVVNHNCPLPNNLGFTDISCSQVPDHSNFNFNQSVHMRNKFLKYYWMMNCVVDNNCQNPIWVNDPPTEEEAYSWLGGSIGVAHELTHMFGYYHVSANDCTHCLDHLMNNTGCGWGTFISPEIVGYMHHALSHTSARKYVSADTFSNTPIPVNQNTTLSDNSRIYRGLSIQNGAQLQLTTELIIPSQVDILVQGTSSFIASGATIHTPSTTSTLDLIVQQNSSVTLTNSTIENCNVSIQSGSLTLNNATIDISSTGNFSVDLGGTLTFNSGTIQ